MSRLENAGNNIKWGLLSTIVPMLVNIFTRISFMNVLGEEYLGINGLFASVLGVLSFADLGLATVFTFCFYKPISENDTEYILVLLNVCKKVFTTIAVLVFVIGCCFIPFLPYLIKGGENIDNIPFYYFCQLLTTVFSYMLVYKTTYISAKQKNYTLVPVELSMNVLTNIIQIVVIIILRKYIYYAVVGLIMVIFRQITLNLYINRKYPETTVPAKGNIRPEDVQSIKKNVKAGITGKIGGIIVYQTDNILTSAFVNIAAAGLLSNYNLIKTTVLNVLGLMNNAITAGMGDLIASENEEVQLNVFDKYISFTCVALAICFCGIAVLSSPFIVLVFGAGKCIDELSVLFMCTAFYFSYQIYALDILTTAGGKKYMTAVVSIIEAAVNLVVSIVGVKLWGLPGVFFGTVCSSLTMYFISPVIVYNKIYHRSAYKYYSFTLRFFLTTLLAYGISMLLRIKIMSDGVTLLNFAVLTVSTGIIIVLTVLIFWWKNNTFKDMLDIIFQYIKNSFVKLKFSK